VSETPETETLADLDKLVHEPARLMVMAHLYVIDEADFTFLANQTGLTGGNLSFHLGKLEQAGYVEVEKRFRDKIPCTLLRLTRAGRAAFREYRTRLTRLLETLPE
jgi:DNA-binding MarR family transcriptional regulator